jgi:hypothetical protein
MARVVITADALQADRVPLDTVKVYFLSREFSC